LAAGCDFFKQAHRPDPPVANRPLPRDLTAEKLVVLLNENANRVQSLRSEDLDMDCKQGGAFGQAVNVNAKMVCQKPRNFMLRASSIAGSEVDLGSNDREFWFWIKRADPPYQYHCSYDDYRRGTVNLPFPFQPEWMMECLGISEYDPSRSYKLVNNAKTLELHEATFSPQGRPMTKVLVLSPQLSANSQPIVLAHKLIDERGKEVCSAQVYSHLQDKATGAIVPHRVKLTWPAEKMEMTLTLDKVLVNPQIDVAFARQPMPGVPSFDLARRTLDAPLRQVRGQDR
jgi:hypothetical protein